MMFLCGGCNQGHMLALGYGPASFPLYISCILGDSLFFPHIEQSGPRSPLVSPVGSVVGCQCWRRAVLGPRAKVLGL